jgi:hypothetical protein
LIRFGVDGVPSCSPGFGSGLGGCFGSGFGRDLVDWRGDAREREFLPVSTLDNSVEGVFCTDDSE